MLFQAAVTQRDRVDAWNKKQDPLVCGALSVKELKLAVDVVCYYTGIERPLTKENMKYVILKDYNDYLQLVKDLKKDQEIKHMKLAACFLGVDVRHGVYINGVAVQWNGHL